MADLIKIEVESTEIRRMIRSGDRVYRQAAAWALNRAARATRSRAIRGISGSTGVPVGKLRRRLYVRNATRRRLDATITTYARSFNPVDLGATDSGTSGVTALGRSWPGAFIATGRKTGKRMVFERRGEKRLPLDSKRIRIYDRASEIVPKVARRMAEAHVNRNLPREIERRLKKAARGGR